jgi:hypothetical protein
VRFSTLGVFFHSNIRTGLLIKGLKSFCINSNLRRKSKFSICIGCQWHEACGFIDTACMVHAGSLTLHAWCMRRHWHCMHGACGVIDTACMHGPCGVIDNACMVHVGSLTLHAWCMRFHWHCMHGACGVIDTACTLHNAGRIIDTALTVHTTCKIKFLINFE